VIKLQHPAQKTEMKHHHVHGYKKASRMSSTEEGMVYMSNVSKKLFPVVDKVSLLNMHQADFFGKKQDPPSPTSIGELLLSSTVHVSDCTAATAKHEDEWEAKTLAKAHAASFLEKGAEALLNLIKERHEEEAARAVAIAAAIAKKRQKVAEHTLRENSLEQISRVKFSNTCNVDMPKTETSLNDTVFSNDIGNELHSEKTDLDLPYNLVSDTPPLCTNNYVDNMSNHKSVFNYTDNELHYEQTDVDPPHNLVGETTSPKERVAILSKRTRHETKVAKKVRYRAVKRTYKKRMRSQKPYVSSRSMNRAKIDAAHMTACGDNNNLTSSSPKNLRVPDLYKVFFGKKLCHKFMQYGPTACSGCNKYHLPLYGIYDKSKYDLAVGCHAGWHSINDEATAVEDGVNGYHVMRYWLHRWYNYVKLWVPQMYKKMCPAFMLRGWSGCRATHTDNECGVPCCKKGLHVVDLYSKQVWKSTEIRAKKWFLTHTKNVCAAAAGTDRVCCKICGEPVKYYLCELHIRKHRPLS